jgi:hypothetical protein
MAVERKQNFLGGQRVDVPHLRSIESGVAADFANLVNRFISSGQINHIIRGLSHNAESVDVEKGSWAITLADSVVLSKTDGICMYKFPSDAEVVYPLQNGSFAENSDYYVGIKIAAVTYDPQIVKFIDDVTNLEISKTVPLAIVLDYEVLPTATSTDSDPNTIWVYKVKSVGGLITASNVEYPNGTRYPFIFEDVKYTNLLDWIQAIGAAAGSALGPAGGVLGYPDSTYPNPNGLAAVLPASVTTSYDVIPIKAYGLPSTHTSRGVLFKIDASTANDGSDFAIQAGVAGPAGIGGAVTLMAAQGGAEDGGDAAGDGGGITILAADGRSGEMLIASSGGSIGIAAGSAGADSGSGGAAGGNMSIFAGDSTDPTVLGGTFSVGSGAGSTSSGAFSGGTGGPVNVNAGFGGAGSVTAQSGQGGEISIFGGQAGADNGAGSGNGGAITVRGGNSFGSNSPSGGPNHGGHVYFLGGNSNEGTHGNGGNVTVSGGYPGTYVGASGSVTISTQNGVKKAAGNIQALAGKGGNAFAKIAPYVGGEIFLQAGEGGDGAEGGANGGGISILAGSSGYDTSGAAAANGDGGGISITTGASTGLGNGGALNITSGGGGDGRSDAFPGIGGKITIQGGDSGTNNGIANTDPSGTVVVSGGSGDIGGYSGGIEITDAPLRYFAPINNAPPVGMSGAGIVLATVKGGVADADNNAGNGGAFGVVLGSGGASDGTHNAGDGGFVNITAGKGGLGSGAKASKVGGGITLQAGNGGNGNGATAAAAGGVLALLSGNSGTASTGNGANGGAVTIDAGNGNKAGTGGGVSIVSGNGGLVSGEGGPIVIFGGLGYGGSSGGRITIDGGSTFGGGSLGTVDVGILTGCDVNIGQSGSSNVTIDGDAIQIGVTGSSTIDIGRSSCGVAVVGSTVDLGVSGSPVETKGKKVETITGLSLTAPTYTLAVPVTPIIRLDNNSGGLVNVNGVTAGLAGQRVLFFNTLNTNVVRFAAGINMFLGAATRDIGQNGVIEMFCDGTSWFEIAYKA